MALEDWVIGSDAEETGEIIVHIAEPWFAVRCDDFEDLDEDYEPSGLTISTDDGLFFHDFRWQSTPVSDEEVVKLCSEAVAALELFDDIEDEERQDWFEQN